MKSLICILISKKDELESGDDAAHGEELAYALWGDGEENAKFHSFIPQERNPSVDNLNLQKEICFRQYIFFGC